MMTKALLTMLTIVLLLLGAGCIPVEDIGEYWHKGIIDPSLKGSWKKTKEELGRYDHFLSFVESGDHYDLRNIPTMASFEMDQIPAIHSKTLILGNHKFLMLDIEQYFSEINAKANELALKMAQDDAEEGLEQGIIFGQSPSFEGCLLKYSIENDTLSMYLPCYEALIQAIKNGQVKGSLSNGGQMSPVTIAKLDEETIQFLLRISDDGKHWEQPERFKRIENLQEELEKSQRLLDEQFALTAESMSTSTYSGKVIDDFNQPVRWTEVRAYRVFGDSAYYLPLKIQLIDKITADNEGKFEFSLVRDESMGGVRDKIMVLAIKEGLALGWTTKGFYGDPNCLITLNQPIQIRGTVVDEDGVAIPQAEVRLILTMEDKFYFRGTVYGFAPVEWLVTTTDEQGQFEFNNLPGGAKVHFLVIAKGYSRYYSDGYSSRESMRRAVKATVGRTSSVRLVLQALSTIEGILIDKSNRAAVPGVELVAERIYGTFERSPAVFCRSTSEGYFRFEDLTPGEYWVKIHDVNDKPSRWKSMPAYFEVRPDETMIGELQASQGGSLQIVVYDFGTNQPIQRARIKVSPRSQSVTRYKSPKRTTVGKKLIPWSGVTRYKETSGDGRISFDLASGEYTIGISAKGYDGQSEVIKLADGQTMILERGLGDEVKTEVFVTDPDGKAVPGLKPQVYSFGGGASELPQTDAEGKFVLSQHQTHTLSRRDRQYFIVARDPDRDLAGVLKISPEFDHLHIELGSGAKLTGRFIDDQGNPIPGINIRLYILGHPVKDKTGKIDNSLVTNENGYFDIRALPKGLEYEMQADPSGYDNFVRRDIQLETHVFNLGDIVLLSADLSISGTVLDEDGKPIAGARINPFGEKQPRLPVVKTDENGRFSVEGVTRARITLNVGREPQYRSIQTECKGGDQNIRIVLEKRIDAEIRALVVNAETQEPIEGVQVIFKCEKTHGSGAVKSNVNGLAVFKCKWKGIYRVAVASVRRKHYTIQPLHAQKTHRAKQQAYTVKMQAGSTYEIEIRVTPQGYQEFLKEMERLSKRRR